MTSPAGAADWTIDILLATYNGAAYLEEQLASIEAQTHPNWRLIARDDGSSDLTPEMLAAFRVRYPERVTILRDGEGNLGLVQNFSRLMEASTAPYATFCDQDDVWLAEKLSLCLERILELEVQHGSDKPLLVFTDLTVVDEELKVIHPSFWQYQGLRPERCNDLNRLLLQNVVTGCTALMNRSLVRKAGPLPRSAIVHDWWVALVAAGFGRSRSVSQPTVLYRQHPENRIGAKSATLLNMLGRACRVLSTNDEIKAKGLSPFTQAKEYSRRFSSCVTPEKERDIQLFLSIPKKNWIFRIVYALRCRCMPSTFIDSINFIMTRKLR
jgi:glycosyltransferase involved in cell wall biosynthesis